MKQKTDDKELVHQIAEGCGGFDLGKTKFLQKKNPTVGDYEWIEFSNYSEGGNETAF